MKRFVHLLAVILLGSLIQRTSADELPADGKLVVGEAYHLLTLEAINDLNDVVLTDGKQKLHATLASVLPYADWPTGEGYDKMKAEFLKELTAGLVGKDVSFNVLEVDPQGRPFGDVSLLHGHGFGQERWGEKSRAADSYGWGMTSINVLLIERGYSPYVKRAYFLGRKAHVTELFETAQRRAITNAVGFRAGKNANNAIQYVAAQQANEINLLLEGLTWPQTLAISQQLLTMKDTMIRRSALNAMLRASGHHSIQWQEVLMAHYFNEEDQYLRYTMLEQLYNSEIPSERLKPFMEKVQQTETDEKHLNVANAVLQRITRKQEAGAK